MAFLAYLRKLILGETWALPLGIAAAVLVTWVLRLLAGPGGAWPAAAGFVLLAGLLVALGLSLPRRHVERAPTGREDGG